MCYHVRHWFTPALLWLTIGGRLPARVCLWINLISTAIRLSASLTWERAAGRLGLCAELRRRKLVTVLYLVMTARHCVCFFFNAFKDLSIHMESYFRMFQIVASQGDGCQNIFQHGRSLCYKKVSIDEWRSWTRLCLRNRLSGRNSL